LAKLAKGITDTQETQDSSQDLREYFEDIQTSSYSTG